MSRPSAAPLRYQSRASVNERLSAGLSSKRVISNQHRNICTAVETAQQREQARLHISTHYHAAFGEHLKVVGNLPELGAWDILRAPELRWTEDHYWVAELDVPVVDDAEFKIVLLSHTGVVWEPGFNRQLQLSSVQSPFLAAALVWGTSHTVLRSVENVTGANKSSVSEEFDVLWDPTRSGLPQDITEDLDTPRIIDARSESRQKYDVTLEPEWAILDGQEERSNEEDKETDVPLHESADLVPNNNDTSKGSSVTGGLKKKKRQPKEKINGLRAAGQAAGYAAAGVAAAVVMSALAVDITDAAIASAIVAAGATFLPSATDADGKKKALKGKGAASPVLGALELGLKAKALVLGLGPAATRAIAQPEKCTTDTQDEATSNVPTGTDGFLDEAAAQAKAFAMQYEPTQEELFEYSTFAANCQEDTVSRFANNAVAADRMQRGEPINSTEKAGQIHK